MRSVISCTCEMTPILRPCVRKLSKASIATRSVSASKEPKPSSMKRLSTASGWMRGKTGLAPVPTKQGTIRPLKGYGRYAPHRTYPGRSPARQAFREPVPADSALSIHAVAHWHSSTVYRAYILALYDDLAPSAEPASSFSFAQRSLSVRRTFNSSCRPETFALFSV
mgnify:CR=1 FL=1